MREILFRGKCLDGGGWVYGYYTVGRMSGDPCIDDLARGHIIDPATVGQFTGLVDKNGKKVFEGDILSIEFHSNGSLFEPSHTWHENAEVVWSQEHFGWYAKFADDELSLWEYDDSKNIEVVGNIHDNPEERSEE